MIGLPIIVLRKPYRFYARLIRPGISHISPWVFATRDGHRTVIHWMMVNTWPTYVWPWMHRTALAYNVAIQWRPSPVWLVQARNPSQNTSTVKPPFTESSIYQGSWKFSDFVSNETKLLVKPRFIEQKLTPSNSLNPCSTVFHFSCLQSYFLPSRNVIATYASSPMIEDTFPRVLYIGKRFMYSLKAGDGNLMFRTHK